MAKISLSCHCGAVAQTLSERVLDDISRIDACHCYNCRHSTGLLYASYYRLQCKSVAELVETGLTQFSVHSGDEGSPDLTLYFCATCGCHVFRSVTMSQGVVVEVASGTLTRGELGGAEPNWPDILGTHTNVESTVDGGITRWMSALGKKESCQHGETAVLQDTPGVLGATCFCKRVSFRVSRPDESSLAAKSPYPDLMIPYHTNDPNVPNAQDVKWWLRQGQTKYLAGLCACKSCRLTSGFELQSWAFIPRTNIMFADGSGQEWSAADFDDLHRRQVMCGYESSPGVVREFCPTCGATVFWHGAFRPELIDVSVGLLESSDGARAEEWLDWWTGRVSFAEDAELDRHGIVGERARRLVEMVEREMRQNTPDT